MMKKLIKALIIILIVLSLSFITWLLDDYGVSYSLVALSASDLAKGADSIVEATVLGSVMLPIPFVGCRYFVLLRPDTVYAGNARGLMLINMDAFGPSTNYDYNRRYGIGERKIFFLNRNSWFSSKPMTWLDDAVYDADRPLNGPLEGLTMDDVLHLREAD